MNRRAMRWLPAGVLALVVCAPAPARAQAAGQTPAPSAEPPTLDDTIEAGEALAKDPGAGS